MIIKELLATQYKKNKETRKTLCQKVKSCHLENFDIANKYYIEK